MDEKKVVDGNVVDGNVASKNGLDGLSEVGKDEGKDETQNKGKDDVEKVVEDIKRKQKKIWGDIVVMKLVEINGVESWVQVPLQLVSSNNVAEAEKYLKDSVQSGELDGGVYQLLRKVKRVSYNVQTIRQVECSEI